MSEEMERHKLLLGAAVMAASLLFAGSPVFTAGKSKEI
jgi:hypothetical protein